MRSCAAPLPALKIAVRGGGAADAVAQNVAVHREAEGAAAFSPFEASVLEDAVEPLGFRFASDAHGSRHHLRPDARVDFAAFQNRRGCPEVREPCIRAGTDKDMLNRNAGHRAAGFEPLIFKPALSGFPLNT